MYWKGYEELEQDPAFVANREKEFPGEVPMDEFLGDGEALDATSTNRRDFLKFLGFSVTAATLAACETPVTKAIPYVVKPETITPGVPNYYASAYYDGKDFASLSVKTREGRPIKVKGNKHCSITHGGTNARIQASVLSLYDGKRAKSALKEGQPIAWSDADKEIITSLQKIADSGKKTVLLSHSIVSPSTKRAIAQFAEVYGNIEHISYDAVSWKSIRDAHREVMGKSIIPCLDFGKAKSIVSIGADFLNGWLFSTAYEHGYAEGRNPDNPHMSRHFQFETVMSLAGANADYRTMIKASEHGAAVVALHNYIASKLGQSKAGNAEVSFSEDIARAGDHLLSNKGKGLVVCGLNDKHAQGLVARINQMLGNYGHTLRTDHTVNLYQGNDAAAAKLAGRIAKGEVAGLIVYGCNPVYSMPNGAELAEAMKGLSLSVSFADRVEETQTQYLLPDHHSLESWNDHEAVTGRYTIQQPTIHPLFDTRQAQESFLVWTGQVRRGNKNNTNFRDFLKKQWQDGLFVGGEGLFFSDFWNSFLFDGVYTAKHNSSESAEAHTEAPVEGVDETVSSSFDAVAAAKALLNASTQGWEVVLYEKAGMGWGNHSNNPILQELPDPITRVTWDNYVTMAPSDMDELNLNKLMGQEQYAHVVKVTLNGKTVELPALAQPGQAPKTIGLALGYGRLFGRQEQKAIGANVFPMLQVSNGYLQTHALGAQVEATDARYQLAGTQTHHTMMGRDIIKETSFGEYQSNPQSGNAPKLLHTNIKELIPEGEHGAPVDKIDYWREFKMINHRWGMSIDLNACTGCGACVVSCHVENNVPVVGKDEIRRSRDMHWLRIDRYYTSDADPSTRYERGNKNHSAKEIPQANPRVAFQPVMCQHCNHAPCETVCPVLATTHSTEGLNQMTYNRCVGTRYCANNCPYKVRRFNWFSYHDNDKFDYYMNDDLGKMVLNPDVTVRARGVMEKCSMCVQRIQAGKLTAKSEGRMVKDGEIQTACAEACPANAIVFGDFNDDKGQLSKKSQEGRAYYLLEEVGVKPNIVYQTKVRNVEEAYGHAAHGHHGGGHDEAHGHSEAGHEEAAHDMPTGH